MAMIDTADVVMISCNAAVASAITPTSMSS